jgi:LuxR family maltose regulon positive regulatory protein
MAVRTIVVTGEATGSFLDGVFERAPGRVLFQGTLHVPELSPGLLPRTELIARLRRERDAAVVVVVAPAGYGKTSLLAQWANEDERPFAWLSVSKGDNDVTVLLAYLAVALNTLEPLDDETFAGLSMSGADLSSVLLPRLRDALRARSSPFVLVIDDVHLLHRGKPMSVLAALAEHVPPGSQLVLAGRTDPPLPLGRIRANRRLLSIGAESLAMSAAEGMALLRTEGVQLDTEVGEALVSRTEGWPAGLYLAALALRDQRDPEAAARTFGGDDPVIADYLREEVLPVEGAQLDFLVRSSVLDRLCGPLCDFVLEASGSAEVLEDLSRSNRFVVPLDRRRAWYRYHSLFSDMLNAQLQRAEPERVAGLHTRASVWLEEQGDAVGAVDHAFAGGDAARVARLIWSNAARYLSYGRSTTVEQWLEPFTTEQLAEQPALALTKGWWSITAGDTGAVEHWLALAERADADERLADGTPLRAATLLLHAVIGTEGITRVRRDAERAFELDRVGSPWRAIARFLEGSTLRLLGEREQARARLEEAVLLAREFVPTIEAQSEGQLALLAMDASAWSEAHALIGEALRLIERDALAERPTMAAVFAAAALSHARLGDATEARAHRKHALGLLEMFRNFAPWLALEAKVVLARASQHLGDVGTARMLVREASAELERYPDAGSLPEQLHEIDQLTVSAPMPLGLNATPLTPAEMRVMRYLPTHLSFEAIAKELYVSRSTVKTQAIAVYRKLGVSSRAQAVDQLSTLGLLE